MPPRDGQQHALDQRLRDDLPARGAERQPHRGLAATRDGAGQQQVGDVGAGDQQHQPAHAEQDAQAAAVLLAHDADAGAGRHDRDRLLRQLLDHAGHPVRRVAGIVLQPLPQDAGQPRRPCRPSSRPASAGRSRAATPRPAGAAAPSRRRSAAPAAAGSTDPADRRAASRRRSPGARHADDGERVALEDERGADDLRIGAVGALPGVMAHHDHRRGRRGVVRRREDAAAERAARRASRSSCRRRSSDRSARAACSTPGRRALTRPWPAWKAVSSSNSGRSAFSRSNSGYENMPQRSWVPPWTQQLSPSPMR